MPKINGKHQLGKMNSRHISPLQRLMLAQCEKLMLLRLAERIAGMEDAEISEISASYPGLYSEWIEDLAGQCDKSQREVERLSAALKHLRRPRSSSRALAA